jgi:DNA polymerase I-like protein with 3'-5' exonuclease and polymerase domains
MFGRVRRIPEVASCHPRVVQAGLRQGGNMPTQSNAAGVFKIGMARVERVLSEWRAMGVYVEALLPIHDELLIEVDAEWAEEVKGMVEVEMAKALVDEAGALQCRCPILAEGHTMARWEKQ